MRLLRQRLQFPSNVFQTKFVSHFMGNCTKLLENNEKLIKRCRGANVVFFYEGFGWRSFKPRVTVTVCNEVSRRKTMETSGHWHENIRLKNVRSTGISEICLHEGFVILRQKTSSFIIFLRWTNATWYFKICNQRWFAYSAETQLLLLA